MTNLVDQISPERIEELEAEGMTTSDAIGVAMAELMPRRCDAIYTTNPRFGMDVCALSDGHEGRHDWRNR